MLREYRSGGDGDFTYEALFQRYNSDLGNDLGNLLNRTLSMVHKFVGAQLLPARPQTNATAGDLLALAQAGWEAFSPANALEATWRVVRAYNQKIDEAKPWVLHKEGRLDELADVLSGCCEALRWAALMVAPAMPVAARRDPASARARRG